MFLLLLLPAPALLFIFVERSERASTALEIVFLVSYVYMTARHPRAMEEGMDVQSEGPVSATTNLYMKDMI